MLDKKTAVLSIAGSDSSAGAGIQADSKAITATGAYAATALTMITAQNTLGVNSIFALPAEMVAAQIDAVFADLNINAVKIGMLYNSEIINTVKKQLLHWQAKNIILDPVMLAQNGASLIDSSAIPTLKALLPLARLITPNIPEANMLLGTMITDVNAMYQAAAQLGEQYQTNILLKGGHLSTALCTDVFFNIDTDQLIPFAQPRLATQNTHGTGCTLAATIASFLAQDDTLERAISNANQYLNTAIKAAINYPIGDGCSPVDHFFMLKNRSL